MLEFDSKAGRKAAIQAYKERKTRRGIFSLRCTVTGDVWVGSSQNLDAVRNRYWFSLGHSMERNRALQEEWNAHGEQAFRYEILEELKDDVSPIEIHDLLKEKKQDWITREKAQPL